MDTLNQRLSLLQMQLTPTLIILRNKKTKQQVTLKRNSANPIADIKKLLRDYEHTSAESYPFWRTMFHHDNTTASRALYDTTNSLGEQLTEILAVKAPSVP